MGKVNKKQLYEAIRKHSCKCGEVIPMSNDCQRGTIVTIGNLLELKIYKDYIDIYKYVDYDKVSDNHNWDSDYITTIYY